MLTASMPRSQFPHFGAPVAGEPPVEPPFFLPAGLSAMRLHVNNLPERRIDLHCHSSRSVEGLFGMRFHPLLDPVQLYQLAKLRGMDYVTITDHDSIEGCVELLNQFGDLPDFIVGEEVSAVFPDDGMIVHVNVYDIDEEQHREIQRLRFNIFELVPYLRSTGKLFQLNHFTWNARHAPFSPERIEQLVDLFDVFEVINGTRTFVHNSLAWRVLEGEDKVFTAGSDSHTDQMGTTYTISYGETRSALLSSIRKGLTAVAGTFGSVANTRRDTRILLNANRRRLLGGSRGWLERLSCEARILLYRMAYRGVARGYYMAEHQRMRQFARSADAVLERRSEGRAGLGAVAGLAGAGTPGVGLGGVDRLGGGLTMAGRGSQGARAGLPELAIAGAGNRAAG